MVKYHNFTVWHCYSKIFDFTKRIGNSAVDLVFCDNLVDKDGFFCALSAISNTGLSTASTGFSGNYAMMPDIAKWLLAFIMLVGRLELFTVLLVFTPSFWRR